MKDYISEINGPSVYNETESPTELTMPIIESYISALEEKRLSFLNSISDKRNGVVKAYISELTSAKQAILKLGLIDNINTSDLIECSKCDDEFGGMCSMFLNLHILYKGIIASIDKTFAFLNAMLDDTIVQPEQREVENKNNHVEPKNIESNSNWLNVDEVCKKYRLSKNKIKSREWRKANKFPTHQDSVYCKVSFNGEEVEEWLGNNKC